MQKRTLYKEIPDKHAGWHKSRLETLKKEQQEYLQEIKQIVHSTDFLVDFNHSGKKSIPKWLTSSEPSARLQVKIPENEEERLAFITRNPQQKSNAVPLQPVHYTRRTSYMMKPVRTLQNTLNSKEKLKCDENSQIYENTSKNQTNDYKDEGNLSNPENSENENDVYIIEENNEQNEQINQNDNLSDYSNTENKYQSNSEENQENNNENSNLQKNESEEGNYDNEDQEEEDIEQYISNLKTQIKNTANLGNDTKSQLL